MTLLDRFPNARQAAAAFGATLTGVTKYTVGESPCPGRIQFTYAFGTWTAYVDFGPEEEARPDILVRRFNDLADRIAAHTGTGSRSLVFA